MKRSSALVALLIVLVLGATGCGSTQPYAAKIDGEIIPTSVVEDEILAITTNPRSAQALDDALGQAGGLRPGGPNTVNAQYTSQVVYTRILATLFDDEIKRLNLQVTPEQRNRAEQALRSGEDAAAFDSFAANYRNYLVERQAQLNALLDNRADPVALQRFYDENRSQFTEICARHILVEEQPKAVDLRNRITGGADFAAIANAESIDNPASQGGQPNGGSLGCFRQSQLGELVKPFADALVALPPNQLSEPVQTEYGFHLIEVQSKREVPFEESRQQIRESIADPSQLFSDLLRGKDVKVNPRYGTWSAGDPRSGQPGQVNPPAPVALAPPPSASESNPGEGGLGGFGGQPQLQQ